MVVSLEGLAMLLDEGLQRHGRAAANRLDHVVGAGEDAGLVVGRHLAPSRTLGRFAPPRHSKQRDYNQSLI